MLLSVLLPLLGGSLNSALPINVEMLVGWLILGIGLWTGRLPWWLIARLIGWLLVGWWIGLWVVWCGWLIVGLASGIIAWLWGELHCLLWLGVGEYAVGGLAVGGEYDGCAGVGEVGEEAESDDVFYVHVFILRMEK